MHVNTNIKFLTDLRRHNGSAVMEQVVNRVGVNGYWTLKNF